jgi:hypothetical protein
MNKVFFDYFENNKNLDIVTESVGESQTPVRKISGIFMQAEKVNRNGRVYARETLQEAVSEYQSLIQDGDSFGALDHPDNLEMRFNEVSHLITRLEMSGNDVFGEAVLIPNTRSGEIINGVLKVKEAMGMPAKVGISSRGAGKLVKRGSQNYVENYKLIAVDLVCRPSAQDAYVSAIRESEYIFENGVIKRGNPVNEKAYSAFLSNYSKLRLI